MIVKQNIKLGFMFAMLTAIMWGTVPIAMKYALLSVDVYTLVWYRFSISALLLLVYLAIKGQLPTLSVFKKRRRLIMLIMATMGLGGNFILFATGVKFLTPTTSQVVGQLGAILFIIANAFVFKERLRPTQILGAFVLVIGLGLFFNRSLAELFSNLSEYSTGVWLVVIASILWAGYALAQKALLQKLTSSQLLGILYLLCTLLTLPLASPLLLFKVSFGGVIAIIYCGLNTLIGYGALVAAMERWQAPQVSSITTLTPLFSLLFSDLLSLIWPNTFNFTYLNVLGYIGAVTVVAGAMFATIGHYFWHPRKGLLINQNLENKK